MTTSEEPTLLEQRLFLINCLARFVTEIAEARAAAGGKLPAEFVEERQQVIEEAREMLRLFDELHPEVVEGIRAEARRVIQACEARDQGLLELVQRVTDSLPQTLH